MKKVIYTVILCLLLSGCTSNINNKKNKQYLFYYNNVEEELGSPYWNENLKNTLDQLSGYTAIYEYPVLDTIGQDKFQSSEVVYSEYMNLIIDGHSVNLIEFCSPMDQVEEFIQAPHVLGYVNHIFNDNSISVKLNDNDDELIDAYLSEDMARYLGMNLKEVTGKSVILELDIYVPVLNSKYSDGFNQLETPYYIYPYNYIFKPVRIQFEIIGILHNNAHIGGPEMIISLDDYQSIVYQNCIEEIEPVRYIVESDHKLDVPKGYHFEEIQW